MLQLQQQGHRSVRAVQQSGVGGQQEKIPLPRFAELVFAGALEQLLEFRPQPAEAGLQAGRLQQPVGVEGIGQGQGIAEAAAAVGAAPPEVGAGGEQVEVHALAAAEGLQQPHLNGGQAAEAEDPQGGSGGIGRQAAQPLDGALHPQGEGLLAQPLAQGPVEEGLPVLAGGQGSRARFLVGTGLPGPQELGPVEAIVVEGIGDRAGQGPGVEAELSGGIPLPQPTPQRFATGLGRQLGQQGQHGPNQPLGPPGIDATGTRIHKARIHQPRPLQPSLRYLPAQRARVPGGCSFSQDLLDNPAQMAAGEGEAQVGGDAAEPQGQLFPQPTAGGPGVHHHRHRGEGIGGGEPQLGRQQVDQQLGAVAPIDVQHGFALQRWWEAIRKLGRPMAAGVGSTDRGEPRGLQRRRWGNHPWHRL